MTSQDELAQATEIREFVVAGRGRRFLTFLVDYVGEFLAVIFAAIIALAVWPGFYGWLEGAGTVEELLIGIGVVLLYYIGFESLGGRTPGKWICGTRVIDDNGNQPSFGQVIVRTFSRLVPFEALSLLFTDDNDLRAWHDRWSRTRVVRVSRTDRDAPTRRA
jgi:uncharacterized RDD family membrane protein YckC